jgi:hypothetical protein
MVIPASAPSACPTGAFCIDNIVHQLYYCFERGSSMTTKVWKILVGFSAVIVVFCVGIIGKNLIRAVRGPEMSPQELAAKQVFSGEMGMLEPGTLVELTEACSAWDGPRVRAARRHSDGTVYLWVGPGASSMVASALGKTCVVKIVRPEDPEWESYARRFIGAPFPRVD